MKSFLVVAVVLLTLISKIANGQSSGFQSFPAYNVAVECGCALKKTATLEEHRLWATVPLGQKMPELKEVAFAYSCKDQANQADYHFEITDRRNLYNSIVVEQAEIMVQQQLEQYSLRCSKNGNTVKWIRIEGVYGVTNSFYFDDYVTYNLYFIKGGVEYRLSVSGHEKTGVDYQHAFTSFVNSFKMR